MATGEIAQSTGVKPEGFKLLELDTGPRASGRGKQWVREFFELSIHTQGPIYLML
ncbi:hypothetical protein N8087_01540 [Porticoccaceae bacterium]|nr:hypothetical protein [Porticoccaceae bacterium]